MRDSNKYRTAVWRHRRLGLKGELCRIESGVEEVIVKRMYENLEEKKVANVKEERMFGHSQV